MSGLSRYWFTTHTGTPLASSGSGGPKVPPFSEFLPVEPSPVQFGLVVASQPERQKFRLVLLGTRKLCELPVTPLSRSLPLEATRNVSWRGPPSARLAQLASGNVVDVVVPQLVPVHGLQRR